MAGLHGREGSLARDLAGGWRQRLALGCAILHEPSLLFLDEPTGGVDPLSRRQFWRLIDSLSHEGVTVLVTTHYLDEADAHADRIVLIRQGRIVADGTTAEIKALATGRSVRATLPDASLDALRALPGVLQAEVRGDSVILQCSDSDAVARYLLTQTAARDLEVVAQNLEAAFVALTSRDATASPASCRPSLPMRLSCTPTSTRLRSARTGPRMCRSSATRAT